jgi:hypothetical protein
MHWAIYIVFRLAASIIMETVYGIKIAPKNDRYILIAEESIKMLGECLFPSATLFNMFPVRESEKGIGFS